MCKKMYSVTLLCDRLCSDKKNCATNVFSVQNLCSDGILTLKKIQSWWQWWTWITKSGKPINLHVTHHTSVFQGMMHIAWQWLDRKCAMSHLPLLHCMAAICWQVATGKLFFSGNIRTFAKKNSSLDAECSSASSDENFFPKTSIGKKPFGLPTSNVGFCCLFS